ncbi:MAG: permease [Candidatus Omnitrophota bacterium]
MKHLVLNFLEFFLVLSGMFLLCAFLAQLIMRKCPVEQFMANLEKEIPWAGYLVATLTGAITPFCVCTTVPIFTTMAQMGIRTGVAVSFLLASPLLSVTGAALIGTLFGFTFTIYYIGSVIVLSLLGGYLVKVFQLEEDIDESIKSAVACEQGQDTLKTSCCKAAAFAGKLFKDLFVPLLIGAVIAGAIHNYVPLKFIEMVNQYPLWLTIPLMALIGFPIYSNIFVLAPICYALVAKGMNPGAVMTFLMAGAGVCIPTAIVLRRILKIRLYAFYFMYTFVVYCAVGAAFNLLR